MQKPKFAGEFPLCFTKQQYDDWLEAARLAPVALGPCHDCTPEYKQSMLEKNRCENPTVVFIKNEDGSLSAHLPTYLW